MREIDPLVHGYSHLTDMPRQSEALRALQKVASVVKPLMRKRDWHVGTLTEFWPDQANLLGLNIDHGAKICLRLRYAGDRNQFLPFEDVVDTMLHELSHIIWGAHDHNFQKQWDELRDEHETLLRKGYTGEGFLSKGNRLGGRNIPLDEMRRQARAAAEKRRVLTKGSGQRLGGAPVARGADMRKIIADAVTRRNTIMKGCASGQKDSDEIAEQATKNGFRTKSQEDDANNRAINQALMDLFEEEEDRKMRGTFTASSSEGLSWDPQQGLSMPGEEQDLERTSTGRRRPPSPPLTRPASLANSSKPLTPANSSRPSTKVTPPTQPGPAPQRKERPVSRLVEEYNGKKRGRASTSSDADPVDLTPSSPAPHSTRSSSSYSGSAFPATWACTVCTLENPQTYLCCDACGVERTEASLKEFEAIQRKQGATSKPPAATKPAREVRTNALGWNCRRCGEYMETKWWTCSNCGLMKSSS